MNTSMAWVIESSLLDIYFLLVKRIKGIGLSLKDFWELDTWTTSKLYCLELDLIDEEERASKGKSNPEKNNDEYTEKVAEGLFET